MKKWNAPELAELSIESTEQNWTGIYRDGGYIGDGIISGHLSWSKPSDESNNTSSSNGSQSASSENNFVNGLS